MCFIIPNSKGGSQECVAIHPDLQGHGAGRALVERVLTDYADLITLTSGMPLFYKKVGFKTFCDLEDRSKAMYKACS